MHSGQEHPHALFASRMRYVMVTMDSCRQKLKIATLDSGLNTPWHVTPSKLHSMNVPCSSGMNCRVDTSESTVQ